MWHPYSWCRSILSHSRSTFRAWCLFQRTCISGERRWSRLQGQLKHESFSRLMPSRRILSCIWWTYCAIMCQSRNVHWKCCSFRLRRRRNGTFLRSRGKGVGVVSIPLFFFFFFFFFLLFWWKLILKHESLNRGDREDSMVSSWVRMNWSFLLEVT